MKKIILIFCILSLLGFFIVRHNTDPAGVISGLINNAQGAQGDLTFKANFFALIPVGTAKFMKPRVELYEGRDVIRLEARANTTGLIARFYKVVCVLDSYLDMDTLNPLYFRQKMILPGKEAIEKEVRYDQRNNTMTLNGVERSILTDTHDPLSVIYNLRRMDFNKVKDFEMSLNTNQKNYVIRGKVELRRVTVGKNKHHIAIARADISRRDKNPYHKSQVAITFWQDKQNLPLVIKVFASGALLNVRLCGIE